MLYEALRALFLAGFDSDLDDFADFFSGALSALPPPRFDRLALSASMRSMIFVSGCSGAYAVIS
jgi:hypothetical protein